MKLVANTPDPKVFHPFCKVCGWRKGGVDSWNGKACKCKHEAPPMPPVEPLNIGQRVRITGGVDARGKVGEVSDLTDAVFVGVRVPDRKRATETIFVTRGSVEAINN